MKRHFGNLPSGIPIYEYTISNEHGLAISALNLGGIITGLYVPYKTGVTNIVLSFDTLTGYWPNKAYIGSLIGRFANRIDRGLFSYNHVDYPLPCNDGINHLHGGIKGFDQQLWEVEFIAHEKNPALEFSYTSVNGEEGYPGEVKVKVVYVLEDLSVRILYRAQTSATTPISLTQHSYFNLSGNFNDTILDHHLQVNAMEFAPINEWQIPLGYLKDVQNSPFDLRQAKLFADIVKNDDSQLTIAGGLDHSWKNESNLDMPLVIVRYEKAKRGLALYTSQPAVHIYSGNFLPNIGLLKHAAFCLETQHFPDAVNKPNLGNPFLHPGEFYNHETIFRFFDY